MVAITDPDRSLEAIPHHDELRELFLNPPGHRRPLLGADLRRARPGVPHRPRPRRAARRGPGDARALPRPGTRRPTPACASGSRSADARSAGRDKLTFLADPAIASFGAWAEQLIAESTGKHGVGIVPVDLEPLGAADAYGSDRVFVRLSLGGSPGPAAAADGTSADGLLTALESAGQPVIRIELDDPIDLAGEFVRWEVATAIAGAVLGIDPFDQPNVEEAKERHAPGCSPRSRRRRASARRPGCRAGAGSPGRTIAVRLALARPSSRELAATARKPNGYARAPGVHRADDGPRRGPRPDPAGCCATGRAARRPPATARASSTRPASSTRAARRPAGSSS